MTIRRRLQIATTKSENPGIAGVLDNEVPAGVRCGEDDNQSRKSVVGGSGLLLLNRGTNTLIR